MDTTPCETPRDETTQDEISQDSYLTSYKNLSVHELMLKDRPRTLAYKNFIEKHAHLFKDKVVMDVGAGTGILSLFASKAGARKVFAVECSGVSDVCELLVQHNGFENTIVVLRGKVEDISLDEKVDVIISEWMGFYLFHESMLFSIFSARDRFLKPDGLILPTSAHLHACPTSMDSHYRESASFWKDVYGFDFSPVVEISVSEKSLEPQIISLKEGDLLSDSHLVTAVEMMYAEEGEYENIPVDLKFPISKYGIIRGLALWFDVLFDVDDDTTEQQESSPDVHRLSTGPKSPETHWKQTVIVLPEAIMVSPGTSFNCRLILSRNPSDRRKYQITLEVPDADEITDNENCEEDDNDEDVSKMIVDRMN